MAGNVETASYVEAYDNLSKAVESVNNCKDIDEIANFVKSGVEAYQVCMERVNQVQKMIESIQSVDKE